MCVSVQNPVRDPEELRREMELQLEAWMKQAPGDREEVPALWMPCKTFLTPDTIYPVILCSHYLPLEVQISV